MISSLTSILLLTHFFPFNSLLSLLLTLPSSRIISGPFLQTWSRLVLADSQQRSLYSDVCRNKRLQLEQAGTLFLQSLQSMRYT